MLDCDICHGIAEDTMYTFINCCFANDYWRIIPMHLGFAISFSILDDLFNFMRSAFVQQLNKEFIAILVWNIWNTCNDRVFNSMYTFLIQIFWKAIMYVSKSNCPPSRYFDNYLPSHNSPSSLISWLLPPSGMIKVNFDGPVTSSTVVATYNIRDQHASFI